MDIVRRKFILVTIVVIIGVLRLGLIGYAQGLIITICNKITSIY